MADSAELKEKFWKALASSPFLFLERSADPTTAIPMTAQLDEDADSAIWFFTGRDQSLAPGGAAKATFSSKGHELFARFNGVLVEETSRERLDKHWNHIVSGWFKGGKDDPNLLFLRMDLNEAEIWNSDLGLVNNVKLLLGFDTSAEAEKQHTVTTL